MSTSISPVDRKTAIRAKILRKRFQGHTESVRQIVADLTDEEICILADRHDAWKLAQFRVNETANSSEA